MTTRTTKINPRNYDHATVIKAFMNGATIIDDHTKEEITVDALFELQGETREICQYIPGTPYQSLNGIYLNINDEKLHIGQASVAGCFRGELNQDNIDRYNRTMTYDSMKIKRVISRDCVRSVA